MDLETPDSWIKKLKIREVTGQYLIGILLMPWIWAFGILLLEFVLISYYNFQPKTVLNDFKLLQIFQQKIDLNQTFWVTTLFVFGNYTIAFFTNKNFAKLGLLLFYLSLFSLIILFSFIWPHFTLVLNQSTT